VTVTNNLINNYDSLDKAAQVGEIMKKRLISIDNDTDDFPEYLLNMIDQVIGIA